MLLARRRAVSLLLLQALVLVHVHFELAVWLPKALAWAALKVNQK